MKKIIIISMLGLLLGAAHANAEYRAGYYDAMEGKKKEALKAATKACVQKHTRLDYYNLPNQWQYTDVYPELVNGCKRWWEMYSNEEYLIAKGQSATKSFSANKMQREHSVPKSWWKLNGDVEYTDAYTDMWNLYPSDGEANMAKSNYPFAEVGSKTSFDNGCTKVGVPTTGLGGGAGYAFEPADEYKGDFARTIFYMATVYDDINWVINYMFQAQSWPTLRPWAYDMLLQWSRKDPVSQKEIDRNDYVEIYQGNRNPFIDFPNLAEYIWGTSTTEAFYIKDQQGGTVTPPIDGDPEMIKPINGEYLDFGQVAVGETITAYLEVQGKNFTAPISLRLTGANKDEFTLARSSISATSLNSGTPYLLPIIFTPVSEGEKAGNIILYDGGMQGSISVKFKAEALPVPELTRLTALPATDITATSYVARWDEPKEVVDFYVVTRVRYTEEGTETETLESDTNSLLIEGCEEGVAESYTVRSSRLGFLSEESNSIYVAPSGVNCRLVDTPMQIGAIEGGIAIIANPAGANLSIYDLTGRLIEVLSAPAPGQTLLLPTGAYLLDSPALPRPLKLLL